MRSSILWILYAPQFHFAISVVALVCLLFNISTWRRVRRIERIIKEPTL